MIITIEISYYPLSDDFNNPVHSFIEKLKSKDVEVDVGIMSTIITGEYDIVMGIITASMKELMDKYPSVFNMKISNSCLIK